MDKETDKEKDKGDAEEDSTKPALTKPWSEKPTKMKPPPKKLQPLTAVAISIRMKHTKYGSRQYAAV
jgi:hypothetical protein